jgi:hypothetical protein
MNKDDIEYVLEILEDATENKDWELLEEARQFLIDILSDKSIKYSEE